MSGWEQFAVEQPLHPGLAEDQQRITSEEEYALFQEEVFTKVANRLLVLPPGMTPEKFSRVVKHPLTTIDHHTRRKQRFTYAYHGFAGHVRWGSVIIVETTSPRGFRVIRTWMGDRINRQNQWISWHDAVRGIY